MSATVVPGSTANDSPFNTALSGRCGYENLTSSKVTFPTRRSFGMIRPFPAAFASASDDGTGLTSMPLSTEPGNLPSKNGCASIAGTRSIIEKTRDAAVCAAAASPANAAACPAPAAQNPSAQSAFMKS